MNTELTADQVKLYREQGCIVVPGFLTADELSVLTNAVTEGVQQFGDKRKLAVHENGKLSFNGDRVEGDSYYDRVFLQRINLWRLNETVKKFMLNPQLGEMLCRLEGIDGVRLWHDQTLQKAPWANPTGWHCDNPKWSFSSEHAISIWIALDDATVQNGCMYYVPGSHKNVSYDDVDIDEDMGGFFTEFPQFKEVDPVVAEMKAGDAGFHNGLLAHGAGPNMTPRWRRAMTAGYMPHDATFNGKQNILSDKQVAKLKVGDYLDDEQQSPLVWKDV